MWCFVSLGGLNDADCSPLSLITANTEDSAKMDQAKGLLLKAALKRRQAREQNVNNNQNAIDKQQEGTNTTQNNSSVSVCRDFCL